MTNDYTDLKDSVEVDVETPFESLSLMFSPRSDNFPNIKTFNDIDSGNIQISTI